MTETQIVNVKTDHAIIREARREGRYVPVHRPFRWGNPFVVGRDGDRDEVIEKHWRWLMEHEELWPEVATLNGKMLGCHCHPKRCHAENLARLAEHLSSQPAPRNAGKTAPRAQNGP